LTIIEAIDITRRIIGLATNVRNEAVGTGNSEETVFSLDNTRVVPGSDTVYLGGTATTAYTINEDTGVITFTSAPGVVAITADYSYVPVETLDIVESDYDDAIAKAEAYVKKVTGKHYVTTASATDWFDLNVKDFDKRTDIDTGILDYAYDFNDTGYRFFTTYKPIVNVSKVIVTENDVGWTKVWSYDGSSYTDNTDEANSVDGDEFELFVEGNTDDYTYLGSPHKFSKFYVNLHTVGVGGTMVAAYYNGSTWVSLSLTDDTSNLTASGYISFTLPNAFEKATVNGVEAYYVRLHPSVAFSTNPKVLQISIDNDYVINKVIDPKTVAVYKTAGEIILRKDIPNEDYRKIRIDYTYGLGSDSVPEDYKELISIVAAKGMITGLLAGSFDNETSWNYRGTGATLGEPYTQFRESLDRLTNREKELLSVVGKVVIMGDV